MNILITGNSGFVGASFSQWLSQRGHTVQGFSVEDGDISQSGALDRFGRVDYVYHLAARTVSVESWAKAQSYYQVNVMGTETVLEYCKRYGVPMFLMSTYVYGPPQYLPVDEKHPIKAISPYHHSKILSEELCRFYAENSGVDVMIFRAFNIYGRGQDNTSVVPLVMEKVLDPSCEALEVMDLAPKRDYVYSKDVLLAMELALNHTQGFNLVNIGSGVSISVEDVIQRVMKVSGIFKPYGAKGIVRKNEVNDCVADIRKAESLLGFHPQYDFDQGIADWLSEMP